jgi:hypothetical protein
MASTLFTNARIVDGTSPEAGAPVSVLVEGGAIREVGKAVTSAKAKVVDLKGKTLMPGLIDAHVHVVAGVADLGRNAQLPDSLVTARSFVIMREMLMRGFTTVRDVGGADFGLKQATEEGHFPTPRLVISGKALSQTGGHADFRGRYDDAATPLTRHRLGALGRICDGLDQVRRAAREEMKGGADFIKIMANGGCASPTDPIHFLGFSVSELEAIVAKTVASGCVRDAALDAMGIHGGRAFLVGHPLGDALHDHLAVGIYEGESDLLGLALFRGLARRHPLARSAAAGWRRAGAWLAWRAGRLAAPTRHDRDLLDRRLRIHAREARAGMGLAARRIDATIRRHGRGLAEHQLEIGEIAATVRDLAAVLATAWHADATACEHRAEAADVWCRLALARVAGRRPRRADHAAVAALGRRVASAPDP